MFCNFPVLDWQNAGTLFEQLCKAARCGIAYHLSDLSHREIGIDEQVFRLAHSPALYVLCNTASKLLFKAVFQFCFAHAGNIRKAL